MRLANPLRLGSPVKSTGTAQHCSRAVPPKGNCQQCHQSDAKGRSFGTPRNPSAPTLEEFNPRIVEIRAGDLKSSIVERKHNLFPEQQVAIAKLSNESLLEFRLHDPISATGRASDLSLTGGHHRTAEIALRVEAGRLSPDTIVKVLLHD
jgi:hypothetical protein